MNAEVALKILAVQETAMKDEAYCGLLEEHRVLDQRLMDTLPTLTPEQWETITDYLGLVFSMHLRLLEIACSPDEKC